jgi:hypothetical protein
LNIIGRQEHLAHARLDDEVAAVAAAARAGSDGLAMLIGLDLVAQILPYKPNSG